MHLIETINNFLTKEECEVIINTEKDNTLIEGRVRNNEISYTERKSEIRYIKIDYLSERITQLLESKYKLKNFSYKNIETFQFTVYKEGGHYNWHTDTGDIFTNRFISLVILLNEDFEGGELQYIDINDTPQTFLKGIGNLFLFSSNIRHAVTKINTGNRYSLVGWVEIKQISDKKTLL